MFAKHALHWAYSIKATKLYKAHISITVNLDIFASIYFCEFWQVYRFIFVLFIFVNSFKCVKQINYNLCTLFSTLSKYASYAYKCPNILSKNTHAGKLFPLLSMCSMQTITYYVPKKSNLGRTMSAMIIVYINNVLVISCLSPKPSIMELYLLIISIGIHIADLYSSKEVFCLQ